MAHRPISFLVGPGRKSLDLMPSCFGSFRRKAVLPPQPRSRGNPPTHRPDCVEKCARYSSLRKSESKNPPPQIQNDPFLPGAASPPTRPQSVVVPRFLSAGLQIFGRAVVILYLVCAFASFPHTALGGSNSRAIDSALASITAEELRESVFFLADPAFEGRKAGTLAAQRAARWLAERFRTLGLTPAGESGDYFQAFGDGMLNVLGIIHGTDPILAEQIIVVGAHFDHIGYRRSHDGENVVVPGADDNATGVAAVLELAEALMLVPVARSVLFALWDGEEKGLLGSRHWVKNSTVPLNRVKVAINLDMVGRLREDRLHVVGARSGVGWRRLFALQNAEGLRLIFSWNLRPDSDHVSFYEAGIPSAMLHTGLHEDYHRPTDTPDRIDYAGMERVVRYALRVIYDLGSRQTLPAFRPEAHKEKPWEELEVAVPRLGIECRQTGENGRGLSVLRVLPQSPAEKAGLKPGDCVLGVNGHEVVAFEEFAWLVASAQESVELLLEHAPEPERRVVRVPLRGKPWPFGLACKVDPADPGVAVVLQVVPGSPAAIAGIQPGDRIWELDGQRLGENPLENLEELAARWRADLAAPAISLTLEREGRVLRATLPPHPSRN